MSEFSKKSSYCGSNIVIHSLLDEYKQVWLLDPKNFCHFTVAVLLSRKLTGYFFFLVIFFRIWSGIYYTVTVKKTEKNNFLKLWRPANFAYRHNLEQSHFYSTFHDVVKNHMT